MTSKSKFIRVLYNMGCDYDEERFGAYDAIVVRDVDYETAFLFDENGTFQEVTTERIR